MVWQAHQTPVNTRLRSRLEDRRLMLGDLLGIRGVNKDFKPLRNQGFPDTSLIASLRADLQMSTLSPFPFSVNTHKGIRKIKKVCLLGPYSTSCCHLLSQKHKKKKNPGWTQMQTLEAEFGAFQRILYYS